MRSGVSTRPRAARHCRGAVEVGAVGMLAGCEIRRRWRSVVALVLLVGVVGAVVFATAAGARRSETALSRFSAASRSGDVSLLLALGYTPTPSQLSALRRLHHVEAAAVLRFYALKPVHAPASLSPAAALDGAMGSVVDRSRLIAGRRANPAAPDEVTIGEVLAAQLHRGVGGHIDFLSYTPAQFAAASSGGGVGRPAAVAGGSAGAGADRGDRAAARRPRRCRRRGRDRRSDTCVQPRVLRPDRELRRGGGDPDEPRCIGCSGSDRGSTADLRQLGRVELTRCSGGYRRRAERDRRPDVGAVDLRRSGGPRGCRRDRDRLDP